MTITPFSPIAWRTSWYDLLIDLNHGYHQWSRICITFPDYLRSWQGVLSFQCSALPTNVCLFVLFLLAIAYLSSFHLCFWLLLFLFAIAYLSSFHLWLLITPFSFSHCLPVFLSFMASDYSIFFSPLLTSLPFISWLLITPFSSFCYLTL